MNGERHILPSGNEHFDDGGATLKKNEAIRQLKRLREELGEYLSATNADNLPRHAAASRDWDLAQIEKIYQQYPDLRPTDDEAKNQVK